MLTTFTNVWFSDALLQPGLIHKLFMHLKKFHPNIRYILGFKFYEGYPLPDYKTVEEYMEHIINMPLQDIPEVFGLHSNADISYQVHKVDK